MDSANRTIQRKSSMDKYLETRPPINFYEEHRNVMLNVFSGLTRMERKVLVMRFGLPSELAQPKTAPKVINEPISEEIGTRVRNFLKVIFDFQEETPSVQTHQVVSDFHNLTPQLIDHLRTHQHDLLAIHPKVFEHLIAEFLACQGFSDIALVGSDPRTAADIFATTPAGQTGDKVRYFIEVKRWKERVGVEVIDRVLGAMRGEREKFGWHASIIVSAVGFKKFRKYSKTELNLRGVWLKDRDALFRWISDYRPNDQGLWLPSPKQKMA